MTDDLLPGEGPTRVVSVSLHAGTIDAVRSRVGKRGVSAFVEEAVQRQIERDNLDEIIAAAEAEHGPVTPEEVNAKRAILAEARRRYRESHDDVA